MADSGRTEAQERAEAMELLEVKLDPDPFGTRRQAALKAAVEAEKPRVEILFESAADFVVRDIPETLWHVDKMLAVGCSIVGAAPKSGKTYLLYDLALATVTGGEFLGRPVQRPGPVNVRSIVPHHVHL